MQVSIKSYLIVPKAKMRRFLQTLGLGLYRVVAWALGRGVAFKCRRRGRIEPLYLHDIPARFGRYPHPKTSAVIWVHAVSLGETRACVPLVDALRAQWPDARLLLTHGTATGWAAGTALLKPGDIQTWLPWDEPGAVRRFLAHHEPRLGVLMETEVWPELVLQCDAKGTPLFLANARLSERSFKKAKRVAPLAELVFARLRAVVPQTQADGQRLRALGATVTAPSGNVKFDVSLDVTQLALGRRWRALLSHPVVLFASSREGEEAAFLAALKAVAEAGQAVQESFHWLLVPRHPNRVAAVQAIFESAGFEVRRRSQWGDAGPDAGGAAQQKVIWLGDTLGEMPLYYGLAHAALLGGSFGPWGGQNLIEAAACGCPVVAGPHTFNFTQATDSALAYGAAVRVPEINEAVEVATAIAGDAALRAEMSVAGETLVADNRGAAARTVAAIAAALA